MNSFLQPRAERYRYLPRERTARTALPWIVALMVFLATLGVAAGIGLGSGVGALGRDFRGEITVQIVEPNPDLLPRQRDAVAAMLRSDGQVSGVRVLAEAELNRLLEPWLGGADLGDTLPMPAMIDARLDRGADLDRLERRVRALSPGAVIDDHARWFAPIGTLAAVLAGIALLAAVLLAAATAAIVVLGTRAGLSRHHESIAVLHLMGAEDSSVAALFQYRLARTALIGATTGFLLAVAVILLVGRLLANIGSGLVSASYLPLWGWAALLLVPVGAVALALYTSRLTVERALRHSL